MDFLEFFFKILENTKTILILNFKEMEKAENRNYESKSFVDISNDFSLLKSSNKLVRIAFFFTLNGRSLRQIKRLVKTIYDDMHFYYFHVDKVILN